MRLLARREKPRRGLDLLLARAGVSPSVRSAVLDDLERRGLVDDRRFCRLYLSEQMRRRPRSYRLLRRDLTRMGAAAEAIEQALAEAVAERSEESLAKAAARKKLRTIGPDPARLSRLLSARGFRASLVRQTVRALLGPESSSRRLRRDDRS